MFFDKKEDSFVNCTTLSLLSDFTLLVIFLPELYRDQMFDNMASSTIQVLLGLDTLANFLE